MLLPTKPMKPSNLGCREVLGRIQPWPEGPAGSENSEAQDSQQEKELFPAFPKKEVLPGEKRAPQLLMKLFPPSIAELSLTNEVSDAMWIPKGQ